MVTESQLVSSEHFAMRRALSGRLLLARPAMARAMSNGRPLEGKIIVVAGSGNPPEEGHGIGAMTSIVLARQGAAVVSVSNVAINCETVTKAIRAEGNQGISHVADCTVSSEVDSLVATCMDTYGKVDVVVNAGIHSALPMGFGKMSEEAWKRGIDLNLNAHFNLVHRFLPVFKQQQRGNFIHFTTIASSVGLGNGNQRHA